MNTDIDDKDQQLSLFDMGFDESENNKPAVKLVTRGNSIRIKAEEDSIKEFADVVLKRIDAICESRQRTPFSFGLRPEMEVLNRSKQKYSYVRFKVLEKIAEKLEVPMYRLVGDRLRFDEQPKGYIVFEDKLYRIHSLTDLQDFLAICKNKLKDRKKKENDRPIYIRRIEALCTDRQTLLKKMHISSARYSTILRQAPSITVPMIKRFADALNVSMVELFREPEEEDFLAMISCQLKDNVRAVCRNFTQYSKLLAHCHEIEQGLKKE